MSRLVREAPRARTHFDPLLSADQEKARLVQSKRDRKKIVEGLLRRLHPGDQIFRGVPRWSGLQPRGSPKTQNPYRSPHALRGGMAVAQ